MLRSFLRSPNSKHIHKLDPLLITHLYFFHSSSISKTPQKEEPNYSSSLTASCLINSCGLSPQSALSASKKINVKSAENPERVVNLLKSYDFKDTQIAKIINNMPKKLLFSDPDTTVRPKLEFLLGIGMSNAQLTKFVSCYPDLLRRSLDKRLKNNVNSLRSIISDDQIPGAVRRCAWLLQSNLDTIFFPNVRTLECYGVPKPNIAKFVFKFPRNSMKVTSQFKATVESIVKMGFNPSSAMFVEAVGVMSSLSPSTWERRAAFYKSLGWSEEQVISAFAKYPCTMSKSEAKIRQMMDFYVNKMHWEPSFLSKRPVLLGFSLEKRIIPRCSVLNVLATKGIVNRKLYSFLECTDKAFLDEYVVKYVDKFPEVLAAYRREDASAFEWPEEIGL